MKVGYITVTYPPVLPVANFGANVTSGVAPLGVQFTDLSTGNPTAWAWDFNSDGVTTRPTRTRSVSSLFPTCTT